MQLSSILFLVIGLLLGGLLAWLSTRGKAASAQDRLRLREQELEQAKADSRTRQAELDRLSADNLSALQKVASLSATLDTERQSTQEKISALTDFEMNVKESFSALAGAALDANSKRLLEFTKSELDKQQKLASTDLKAKETAIETLLTPVRETLQQLTEQTQNLEVKREGAYEAVLAEVKNIQTSQADLRKETTQLVQALRAPKARGNWGELQLRKCVEFAGMLEHASFDVQKFVRGEDAAYQPDLIVRLPNDRIIVVDAKTPLDAFLDANSTEDESLKRAKLLAHAKRVREHLTELSSKNYAKQFKESPDFIVCFLPSEVLFSAALEQDPSLIEFSASSNVLLATPTTLIALLKAVAYGWWQTESTRNADKIKETALKLYDKLAGMHDSFINLGKRLKSAAAEYDDMLTRAEGKGGVFSLSRKMHELGIGDDELPSTAPLGLTTKTLEADDWQPSSLSLAAESEKPVNKTK